VKDGIARLTWVAGTYNDRGLYRVMSEAVYDSVGSWEFYRKPVWFTLAARRLPAPTIPCHRACDAPLPEKLPRHRSLARADGL
jgi:hypothetical protein